MPNTIRNSATSFSVYTEFFRSLLKVLEICFIIWHCRKLRGGKPGRPSARGTRTIKLLLFFSGSLVVGLFVLPGEFEEHDFLALAVDIVQYTVGADSAAGKTKESPILHVCMGCSRRGPLRPSRHRGFLMQFC